MSLVLRTFSCCARAAPFAACLASPPFPCCFRPCGCPLAPCPLPPLFLLSAPPPVCSCLVLPPLVPPAAGRPPALRLVACWQLVFCCAARPFALPRARLSASRPVLSACSAICPPLLARSMMLPCLLRFLPFSSNSGFSLLFFRLRRACRWLWFGCVCWSPRGFGSGAAVS